MNMKQYYRDRFSWIFTYRKKGFLYGALKTLCILVGFPCYLVSFVVEMALTLVNAIFSWIPLLNMVVQVICKVIIIILGIPFYWCVLPDIGAYTEWEKAQNQQDEQAEVDTTPQLQAEVVEVEQTETDGVN